ncbi:MAG: hypothetical protein K2J20_06090, partial [Bacilli bacterium]|nr:hypothetical protein [Bacilli bacterium]
MKIEDVITLENGKEYVILDIVMYENEKYLYCIGIDKEEKPTKEYIYLKGIEENGQFYIEEVDDEKVLKAIIALFTANYLANE